MIRRIIMVAAAAAALIFVPSAAMAVPAPVFTTCTVTPSSPATGEPFKVACTGGPAHARITLKIAGNKSITTQLNSKGAGTFNVRLTKVGTFTLNVTSSRGAVLFTQTVTTHKPYHAPRYNCTVSDSTPQSGEHVKVHCDGDDANQRVTHTVSSDSGSRNNHDIEIAGTKSFVTTSSATGVSDFTVTVAAAGSYTLSAANAAGALGSSQILTVGAAAPAATVGSLSRTGFDPTGLAVGGGVLLLAGAGAVLVAKRRRSSQVSA